MSSDGPPTAPLKNKKLSSTVTKRSTITARSRSTSVMPVSTTPAPGALSSAPGEAELDDAEDGMEDKLYCVCKTKYDDERIMIACDRCAAANGWVANHSYTMAYTVVTSGITRRALTCQTSKLTSSTNSFVHLAWRVRLLHGPLHSTNLFVDMTFREPSPRSAHDLETSLPERAQAA